MLQCGCSDSLDTGCHRVPVWTSIPIAPLRRTCSTKGLHRHCRQLCAERVRVCNHGIVTVFRFRRWAAPPRRSAPLTPTSSRRKCSCRAAVLNRPSVLLCGAGPLNAKSRAPKDTTFFFVWGVCCCVTLCRCCSPSPKQQPGSAAVLPPPQLCISSSRRLIKRLRVNSSLRLSSSPFAILQLLRGLRDVKTVGLLVHGHGHAAVQNGIQDQRQPKTPSFWRQVGWVLLLFGIFF
jgi:hypothetical protein